jgi:hypothetical protein
LARNVVFASRREVLAPWALCISVTVIIILLAILT